MSDALIVGDWTVTPEKPNTFHRSFTIRRSSPLQVEYMTLERRRGRYLDATYAAEVLEGRVNHGWDDKKGEWYSSGFVHVRLLRADGQFYESGWRAGSIRIDTLGIRGQEMRPDIHTFIDEIIEATRPQTKITITEEPANG